MWDCYVKTTEGHSSESGPVVTSQFWSDTGDSGPAGPPRSNRVAAPALEPRFYEMSDERSQPRWCAGCGSQHAAQTHCPGELPATGPERLVWRINAETPRGIEAFGVLLAPSDARWRARIMTLPNVLWVGPDRGKSIKFSAATPLEAQRAAVEFLSDYCRSQRYRLRASAQLIRPEQLSQDSDEDSSEQRTPAPRKIRFLPVRFGVVGPSEVGGTGNLSETGVFVLTNAPLDSGTPLTLTVKIDRGMVQLKGRVRWMRKAHHVGGSPGMGVELLSPPQPYVEYVRNLS